MVARLIAARRGPQIAGLSRQGIAVSKSRNSTKSTKKNYRTQHSQSQDIRAITEAPGYGEADANYRRFALRFRPRHQVFACEQ
jgi:hypothetical protein